jgi:hypothetical protein
MTNHRSCVLEEKSFDSLPIVAKKPESEKEEKFLREVVEYEFYNTEEPGMSNSFPYGSTKKQHTFTFKHGEKYKVPRHVARWVESRSTPLYNWTPNGSGQMIKNRAGTKTRFQMKQVYS